MYLFTLFTLVAVISALPYQDIEDPDAPEDVRSRKTRSLGTATSMFNQFKAGLNGAIKRANELTELLESYSLTMEKEPLTLSRQKLGYIRRFLNNNQYTLPMLTKYEKKLDGSSYTIQKLNIGRLVINWAQGKMNEYQAYMKTHSGTTKPAPTYSIGTFAQEDAKDIIFYVNALGTMYTHFRQRFEFSKSRVSQVFLRIIADIYSAAYQPAKDMSFRVTRYPQYKDFCDPGDKVPTTLTDWTKLMTSKKIAKEIYDAVHKQQGLLMKNLEYEDAPAFSQYSINQRASKFLGECTSFRNLMKLKYSHLKMVADHFVPKLDENYRKQFKMKMEMTEMTIKKSIDEKFEEYKANFSSDYWRRVVTLLAKIKQMYKALFVLEDQIMEAANAIDTRGPQKAAALVPVVTQTYEKCSQLNSHIRSLISRSDATTLDPATRVTLVRKLQKLNEDIFFKVKKPFLAIKDAIQEDSWKTMLQYAKIGQKIVKDIQDIKNRWKTAVEG